jgi:hypothetical protein
MQKVSRRTLDIPIKAPNRAGERIWSSLCSAWVIRPSRLDVFGSFYALCPIDDHLSFPICRSQEPSCRVAVKAVRRARPRYGPRRTQTTALTGASAAARYCDADRKRGLRRHSEVVRIQDCHCLIEGINSLVQAAKAKARGYRSTRNLKAITHLIAAKLELKLPMRISGEPPIIRRREYKHWVESKNV